MPKKLKELWFVRVLDGHPKLDKGWWLWDPNAYHLFGSIARIRNKKFGLNIYGNRPNSKQEFSSLLEIFDYVQEAYDMTVVEKSPDDMPDPDDL